MGRILTYMLVALGIMVVPVALGLPMWLVLVISVAALIWLVKGLSRGG